MNFNDLSDRKTDLLSLPKQNYQWRIPIFFALCLLPYAYINIAVFHTFVELFAIGIAVMSFVVAWNTFNFLRNRFLMFLGCVYFWVGILDLFHTLTFKNVITFADVQPDTTLQFWILARYLEALSLLVAPFLIFRKIEPIKVFLVLALINVLVIAAVFARWFPDMLIPGQGLTAAKVYSEYTIIAILILAAITIRVKRRNIEKSTSNLLLISIALTAVAEICFTLYKGLDEAPLIIGHFFKLFSFWAIYCALIDSSLKRPFHSLLRVVHSYDALAESTVIIDEKGLIQHANKSVTSKLGEDVLGKNCHDVLHPSSIDRNECLICAAIDHKESLQTFEFEDKERQAWLETNLSPIYNTETYSVMVHSIRDVTERKKTELQFNSLNRLYNVLSKTNRAIAQTQDQEQLFQQVCEIATEYGLFKMAWIGVIDGNNVRPDFFAGAETGYLREMQMRIDDSEWAQGPVGIAAKTLDVACVNSVTKDPNFEPWREAAIQRGYGALAAVPLLLNEKLFGMFTVYSDHEDAFDADMLVLLRSLSEDISAAIHNFEQANYSLIADAKIRQLSSAVEQSANAVIISDLKALVEYVNPSFTNLTGYHFEEVYKKNIYKALGFDRRGKAYFEITKALKSGKSWHGEVESIRRNGDTYWTIQTISPIKNDEGQVTHFVSTAADNTELHKAQETIELLAFYDPLTGLANRRLLKDRIEHDLASAKRHKERLAVILCDLDDFKAINDSLGHELGDKLLEHVAHTLKANVTQEDTAARLGGDEFVLLISGNKNEKCIAEIATGILQGLTEPTYLSNNKVSISSSVGIAMYPQDGNTASELMRNADLAMYHAKNDGKNRFQFFQEQMNESAKSRLLLESKLRKATEKELFELYYQPQVNISNGEIFGLEALIRWHDPEDGFIPPDKFIPIAEENGLIETIGGWVIEQAYRDWQTIIDLGEDSIRMSVNVAALQFRQASKLCDVIKEMSEKYPACSAGKFTIELTEGTLIDNVDETVETLNALKKLGISIAIDDFGTGYSSLNYLKNFPIDELKIDRTFVKDLLNGENDEGITTAIIFIANKLGMKIVAEGIEEREQSELLLQLGCEHAQGYYYHRPMPMSEIEQLITVNLKKES